MTLSNGGIAGTVYTLKWRADVGIVWQTAVPFQINYEGPYFGQSRLLGQRWTLMRGTRVIQLDTATGELVLDETWPGDVSETGAQVYDAVTDTLLVHGTQRLGAGSSSIVVAATARRCRGSSPISAPAPVSASRISTSPI